MQLLLNQSILAQAFAAWETDFRQNPETFYTPEEVAALEIADLSEQRAIHLIALLRQVAEENAHG